MLKRIALPGGINRDSTQFAAVDSWYDMNNMRFRGGMPETVGGWGRMTIDVGITEEPKFELEGIGRKCFSARTYPGYLYRYVATNQKLYVISPSKVSDITPNKSEALNQTNIFTTVNASNTVTVAESTAVEVGDFVVFQNVVGFNNISAEVFNRHEGFQILSVNSAANTYTINVNTPANAGSSGGGSTVIDVYYKVSSGLNTSAVGTGWGVGPWGGDDYTATSYSMETITDDITIISTTQATLNVTSQAIPVGLANPDQVYVIGLTSTTLDGINLDDINDNWWTVVSTDSSNTITINLPYDAITGSGTGGGKAATYYRYDADAPAVSPYDVVGAVDGATRGWDTPSAAGVAETEAIRRVYVDNYGEDILFANNGGPIYYWDVSANTGPGVPNGGPEYVAKDIADFVGSSDAPIIVDSFLVSKKDGHVVAMGCNDIGSSDNNTLLVRWSDQNNPFDWTPSATNTSGGQMLRSGSKIIGGVSTKDEVIIFTDSAVYSMRFIGPPEIFSFTLVTDGVAILNDASAVAAANAVFFMGNDGFYVYSGSVSPLPSSVTKYVFDDFNVNMKEKVFGAVNSAFSEVSWFYPSKNSFEPDRYVTLNYDENVWSYGNYDMSALPESTSDYVTTSYVRTSWYDASVDDFPMATYVTNWNSMMVPADRGGGVGVTQKSGVMFHEMGTQAQEVSIGAYIESGDISISDGDYVSFYSRVVPDIQVFDVGGDVTPILEMSLTGKDYPGSSSTTVQNLTKCILIDLSDFSYSPTGNDSGVRGRGRSLKMKLSGASFGYGWRVGDFRIDIQPDGKR